jgi:uncharacterized protein YkwD
LLLAGCAVGTDTTTADAGPPTPDQAAWLDPHNAVRANPNPAPANPLPALTWSDGAAQVAQAWADNCVNVHNDNRGPRGENIAADAPAGSLNPATVVGNWAAEVKVYDYASNTCIGGADCLHYTQIVWAGTTRVGCGHAICNTNSPFGDSRPWDFWVCDYEPPGNVIGQRPY